MFSLKMVARVIYRKAYFYKVALLCRLFGTDYLTQEISICSPRWLGDLLERYGATVGDGVVFKSGLIVDNVVKKSSIRHVLANIHIGHKCHIGRGVFFDLADRICIEDECVISASVKFVTHADCGDRMMSRWYPRKQGEILVGRGSWIGINSVILNSVAIGQCCVIGAGAVVISSFGERSVVVGVPARLVKTLEE